MVGEATMSVDEWLRKIKAEWHLSDGSEATKHGG